MCGMAHEGQQPKQPNNLWYTPGKKKLQTVTPTHKMPILLGLCFSAGRRHNSPPRSLLACLPFPSSSRILILELVNIPVSQGRLRHLPIHYNGRNIP
jgi:hypothetical protein